MLMTGYSPGYPLHSHSMVRIKIIPTCLELSINSRRRSLKYALRAKNITLDRTKVKYFNIIDEYESKHTCSCKNVQLNIRKTCEKKRTGVQERHIEQCVKMTELVV